MKEKADRPRHATSELRCRRIQLVLSAEAVAREAGLTPSKLYRIERAPERARFGDVLALTETLTRLEAEK